MKRILFFIVCISIISTTFADPNAPDINAQLIQAAKDGNLAAVQTLLDSGADINAKRSTDGVTALMWAALNGHKEIVKLLMEKGTDINAKSDSGMTALGAAKSQGHTDIVQMLEKAAAPAGFAEKNTQLTQTAKDSNLPAVQTENKEDKFPLSDAANRGNIEKVKELIAQGYNVNIPDDDNWTPLHRALQSGNKEIAAILIANGADVNAKNNIGGIPIMIAVIRDYNDIVEMLIAKGAEKTIYVAAAQGDIESVKAFLKKDPNLINALASNDGWSALHWAAYMGHLDMIKFLIENGADVNIRDSRGDKATPLFWAVYKGRLDASKLLIDKGADVKIRMKGGRTILHSPGTFETAKLLIDNGADVNAKDVNGITPLHSIDFYEVQKILFWKNGGTVSTWKADLEKYRDAAEKFTAEIAELLIKNGADVNAKDEKGNTPLSNAKAANNKALIELLEKYNVTLPAVQTTPAKGADVNTESFALHKAAYEGNLEEIKTLIAKGADVNARWPKDANLTPLHFAVSKGNEEILKWLKDFKNVTKNADSSLYKDIVSLLIEKGADVNAKLPDGWTPLHLSAYYGYIDMAELLIAKGADLEATDKNSGRTPLSIAALYNHKDIENLLITKGAKIDIFAASAMGDIERVKAFLVSDPNMVNAVRIDFTPLHEAAYGGQIEIVKLLIEKGVNINAGYPQKQTPLYFAATKGHLDIVELLISKGANMNSDEFPPLRGAVMVENKEAVEFLISKGADVNAKDSRGMTALFAAVIRGNKNIAELLIAKGADVNAKNIKGITPLHIAATSDNKDITELLIAKGADINIKDNNGKTALDMAKEKGRTDIVQLLEKPASAAQEEKKFPLNDAAGEDNIEKVKELIAKGANVNERQDGNFTPLMWAARNGNKEMVELLMANGADINAKNDIGSTPLMQAIIFKHNDIAELLIKKGVQRTIFVSAAMGDIENVKSLLTKEPNSVNDLSPDNGWSALHWAAYNGDLEMIKILLENKANVNIFDKLGANTPLFWATYKNHIEAAKLLIDNKADIKIKLKNGDSILHHQGSLETVKLLIDNGADVNTKDANGITPLHSIASKDGLSRAARILADKSGWTFKTWKEDFEKQREPAQKVTAQIAELLIAKGADINAKDEKGNTPLVVAADSGNKDIVELLFAKGADVNVPSELFIGSSGDSVFLSGQWNDRESFNQPVTPRLGSTFNTFRWTAGDAGIKWPVTGGHDYRLQLVCIIRPYATEPNIFVNDRYVATIKGTDWQFLDINIPANIIGDNNVAQVEIKGRVWTPFEKEPPSPDKRNLGITVTMFSMTELSADTPTDQNQQDNNSTKIVTFKSAEPAPENFDAWCFEGMAPTGDPNATFWSVVIQPDGQECDKRDSLISATNRYFKLYFKPGSSECNPQVFYNDYIKVSIRADKGNVVFEQSDIASFKFQFCRKDADGKIDWNKPFKTIDAVIEP